MAKLLYQGHGSLRITTECGVVIYVDPYAGGGYDAPADIVLMSHEHGDHSKIELVTQKPGCAVISWADALKGGRHNSFEVHGVKITSVLAGNKNHDPEKCVGFVIEADGVNVYAAGDTSKTADMQGKLAGMALDYALLPIDGHYNMGPEEAAECAEMIGARHAIPIHMKPGSLFDRECAEKFVAKGRIIIELGQEIDL